MTQELRKLSEKYPVPQEKKMVKSIDDLEEIVDGYRQLESKSTDMVETNKLLRFIDSLKYAITTMKIYRKLTKTLSGTAGEANNHEKSSRSV